MHWYQVLGISYHLLQTLSIDCCTIVCDTMLSLQVADEGNIGYNIWHLHVSMRYTACLDFFVSLVGLSFSVAFVYVLIPLFRCVFGVAVQQQENEVTEKRDVPGHMPKMVPVCCLFATPLYTWLFLFATHTPTMGIQYWLKITTVVASTISLAHGASFLFLLITPMTSW